ncbi:hypothetical protein FHS96_004766, partial [Sphingomonas zeicaulis]|uniref:hypothetical protein n=1 Tax=Sphingomonas zeicaulis TaxID=1632740 RepID=UPI003D1CE2B7
MASGNTREIVELNDREFNLIDLDVFAAIDASVARSPRSVIGGASLRLTMLAIIELAGMRTFVAVATEGPSPPRRFPDQSLEVSSGTTLKRSPTRPMSATWK